MIEGTDLARRPDTTVAVAVQRPCRIWRASLDCDHEVLVVARDVDEARAEAQEAVRRHRATVVEVEEVAISLPMTLAIYPGPWSAHAVEA